MSEPRGLERILIVRLAALGDLVMTSVLLERIRTERHTARVTWLCGNAGAPLVRLFSGVDDVIAVDEHELLRAPNRRRIAAMLRLWQRLALRHFTEVLIAHADRRFSLIALPCRGARVAMLSRALTERMNPIPGRFFGDEYARLLDRDTADGPITTSYDVSDVRPRLAPLHAGTLPATAGPIAVLVPGGARNVLRDAPLRRWPVERYAAVARTLVAHGCDVVLIGDEADRWVCDAFDGMPVIDLVGRLRLEETLGVLARADVVISHDTGPLHLARAVRAPIVALFGPTMPRQMLGAAPANVVTLWGGEGLACRPCYNGRDFAACRNNVCMQDIAVSQVIEEATRLLDQRTASSGAARATDRGVSLVGD